MSAFKIVQNIETVAVSSTGISTSSPIPLRSGYLKISSDENVYVELSPTPTLSTSSLWIAAGETIILKETVTSQRLVGISTGTTTHLYLPEGTFSDFAIGDYVQVTGIGYTSDLNTDFAEVLSVDTTQGIDGWYSRKIEIDFDTSSIFYPMDYSRGNNPLIIPDPYNPIPSPVPGMENIGSQGNVTYGSEVRRVIKLGAMGDGTAANVHITEIQIAGG